MTTNAGQRRSPFAQAMHRLAGLREPACLLDPEGIVLFVNDAWDRFATDNGGGTRSGSGGVVGTRWLDGIHGEEPRRLHAELLHRALRREGDGPAGAVVHTSENNDPLRARLSATRLEALASATGALMAVAVTHRRVRDRPIAEVYAPVEGDGSGHRSADGTWEQCGCCRRTRRPGPDEEWDFVRTLVAVPPPTTRFVYCPLCLELHGPGVPGPDGPGGA